MATNFLQLATVFCLQYFAYQRNRRCESATYKAEKKLWKLSKEKLKPFFDAWRTWWFEVYLNTGENFSIYLLLYRQLKQSPSAISNVFIRFLSYSYLEISFWSICDAIELLFDFEIFIFHSKTIFCTKKWWASSFINWAWWRFFDFATRMKYFCRKLTDWFLVSWLEIRR